LILHGEPEKVTDEFAGKFVPITFCRSQKKNRIGRSNGSQHSLEGSESEGVVQRGIPSLNVGNVNHTGLVPPDFCEQTDNNLFHGLVSVSIWRLSRRQWTYPSVIQDAGEIKVLDMNSFKIVKNSR
jgi:hypothetical protein